MTSPRHSDVKVVVIQKRRKYNIPSNTQYLRH